MKPDLPSAEIFFAQSLEESLLLRLSIDEILAYGGTNAVSLTILQNSIAVISAS